MGKSQHAIFPIQCGPVFLGVTTTLGRVLVRGPLSLSLLDVFWIRIERSGSLIFSIYVSRNK